MPRQYEKYFVDPFSGFRGRRGQSMVISQKLEKKSLPVDGFKYYFKGD